MDGNGNTNDVETDGPALNLNSPPSTSISQSKSYQPTLQYLIKKKEMWSLDDPKALNITKKICEMMALDAEPFALVERKGFQRLMNYLAPQYPLPCRTYFSEKIMPYLYKNLKAYKEKLITAKNISFSTDIWTSPANNESFISLTAHFIRSDDMNREILVLSAKHFPGSHTGSNIGQILNDVMEEWQISSSQIHLILRDNASNMIIGTDILGESVGCFIHTLQLVIHDCIFKNRNFVEILGKCRKIVGHFNHSSLACSKLKNIQESLKLPVHKLIQDVSTRWNATFYMLSRLHEQRQAVTAYAAEKDIPSLSAIQWNMVENVIRVLQPFEEMTKIASSDFETIGYVIPAIVTLHSYLSKRQRDTGVMMLKEDLKKAMEERFLNPIGLNVKDQKCARYRIRSKIQNKILFRRK
ncbi:zinc finger BED domain-containing protein 4-like [Camponotus floridanus]|uniref:zinc finger BED domain-containing protein 4-like n=1 Tax=Camponotus floridanus TaxID=104421 RepID=UPI000DC6BEE7|nr:zinc finger BED domain-containing protein 4-like [Camponotus floridanus]